MNQRNKWFCWKKWIATEGKEAAITIGLTHGKKIRKHEQKL